MGEVTIRFNTDNAAWQDYPFDSIEHVQEQIFETLLAGIRTTVSGGTSRILRDSNGNTIGTIAYRNTGKE
jgi:hypothetical protein